MHQSPTSRRARLLQGVIHLASLAPLAATIWAGLHGDLTANPIQAIIQRAGRYALILLTASLACAPLSSIFELRVAIRWRRPLGLYAFMYAALHFGVFVAVDYGFDLVLLREAIFEKRFALVGFAAGLVLLALAITSTRGWARRLGRRWEQLHRLVYVAGLLAVIHYAWAVKADIRQPLAWGAVIVLLLILRLPPVRH
ncbi:MAG: sulfoxide reductase heme-binding subunit YedZ [Chloroflexi bacterium]|nr:sulfoxide reductase heme-binding subunit YedZ [Chloroflexota bacterium]